MVGKRSMSMWVDFCPQAAQITNRNGHGRSMSLVSHFGRFGRCDFPSSLTRFMISPLPFPKLNSLNMELKWKHDSLNTNSNSPMPVENPSHGHHPLVRIALCGLACEQCERIPEQRHRSAEPWGVLPTVGAHYLAKPERPQQAASGSVFLCFSLVLQGGAWGR